MSRLCDLSGRKTSTGNHKKHRRGSSGGGGAWAYRAQKVKRNWYPNLRKIRIEVDGKTETVKVSMKAYKTLRNKGTYKGATLVS